MKRAVVGSWLARLWRAERNFRNAAILTPLANGLPEERPIERSTADHHPGDFLELERYIVSPRWVETTVEEERG